MKQGWENKTLGDVLAVLRNGVNCKQDKKGVGDKISRIESISNADFDIDKVGYTTLSASDKKKYKLEKGDILFSHINSPIHVGKTALFNSDEEVYHGVNLLLMRPKPFLNNSYFEHYLKFLFQNGYWKGLCKQSVNQASVNQQDINKVEIKYPISIPEQQRIVSILDKAFAAIDKAKANAVQNLKNAKELFESYLQSVFENGNWVEKTLGDVCEFTQGIQRDVKLQSEIQKENQVRFLRIVDFTQGNEPPRFIDNPGDKYILNSSDISLVRYGASTGFVCRGLEGALANNLFRVIPKTKKEITNDFLFVYLNAPIFQNVIKESMNGAAMPAISFGLIKDIPFPIISLKEQETIVQKLNALSAETTKLEAIYQKKLEDLEELKKSILQKAFSGELNTTKDIAV